MKRLHLKIFFACLLFCFVVQAQEWKTKTSNADYLHRAIKEVTDVMVYDIYSPPVTSRTYAYVCVAAYETLIHQDSDYTSLSGQLHGLTPPPQPDVRKEYCYTLAAVKALLTVGKALVISEEKINAFEASLLDEFKADGMPADVMQNSLDYGKQMATHILSWAAEDNYKQSRSLPKYAVDEENPATWKPTPPAYIKAIEPHWNKIRTFVTDSAEQFKPAPALAFSTNKQSSFYKAALAVRDAGVHLNADQKTIANFWDCNPFKMNVRGHVMYATKKISPNGHWINVAGLACKQTHADVVRSAATYACLAVTLADCLISCWDEKYRSNVVRPETYINQYIDTAWLPAIQTPPFPEHTSGHSVISSAASVVLTKLFGNITYTDFTEAEFGLQPRTFTSFDSAAKEAAISRFYGGIHYMPAINNGLKEGDAIGKFVLQKLYMKQPQRVL